MPFLFYLLLFLVCLFGWLIHSVHVRVQKKLFAYTLLVLFAVFLVVAPGLVYFSGSPFYWGNYIEPWFKPALAIYVIFMLSVIFSFTGLGLINGLIANRLSKIEFPDGFFSFGKIQFLFWFFLALVAINYLPEAISVSGTVIMPYSLGVTPFLEALIDSLVCVVILGAWMQGFKKSTMLWFIIVFVIILLTGWRFRMFMLVLGLLVALCFWSKVKPFHIVLLLLAMAYLVIFLSVNRWVLLHGYYHLITFNPVYFSGGLLTNQLSSFPSLAALLKYRQTQMLPPDYGFSLWMGLVNRLPFVHFGSVPYITFLRQMHQTPEGILSGSALTIVGEFYYYFGMAGVVFIGLVVGALARLPLWLSYKTSLIFQLIFVPLSFQFFTRGYLPQNIELIIYFCLPLLILWFKRKKNANKRQNLQ